MPPSFLSNKGLKLLLFGGKGGNGKTTSAAATAIRLAKFNEKRKILVVSTDPAHSLGDSFDCSIGDSITPIKGINNLWAQEIRAEEVDKDFKKKYEKVIKKIIDRGTYFDKEDVANFSDLPLPGLDEVMAVIRIIGLLKDYQYDLIIIDTAPTGHTIKLLAAPDMMRKWLGVFDMMLAKHRYMARHFAGRYIKDDADDFLETMTSDIDRLRALLKSNETEFVPVTIPESLAIYETERLLTTLKNYEIPVKNIIINRIESGSKQCKFCMSRMKDQQNQLNQIKEKFNSFNLVKMPLFPYEIRGISHLTEFGEVLFGKDYQAEKNRVSKFLPFSFLSRPERKIGRFPEEERLIFLFGGKGGVGKTVTASATALYIARKNPNKKVLIFSADPASSLSDSFNCLIGDKVTQIGTTKNLFALEVNAKKLFDNFIKDYKEKIEDAFSRFLGSGMDIKFDREVMAELINLSPPGLDEIMALIKFVEFIEKESYDYYVLDTAATGHLIRFLELPKLIRDWLKAIFKLLLKYKGVVRLAESANDLVELSKNIRKVQEILADPKRSEFIAITIPEIMGFKETERLLKSLENLKIPCHYIIINMVIPPTQCSFCEAKRKEEIKSIREVKSRSFRKYKVGEVPLFPHEIRGKNNLIELSESLYG